MGVGSSCLSGAAYEVVRVCVCVCVCAPYNDMLLQQLRQVGERH